MSQKITDPAKLAIFIKEVSNIYSCDPLPLTHPSQLYRTKFNVKTSMRKKVSLQIFKNGTVFFQGSSLISSDIFQKETTQIMNLIKDIVANK